MPLIDCIEEPYTIMFSGAEVEQIKLLKQDKIGKDTIGIKYMDRSKD